MVTVFIFICIFSPFTFCLYVWASGYFAYLNMTRGSEGVFTQFCSQYTTFVVKILTNMISNSNFFYKSGLGMTMNNSKCNKV